MAKIYGIDVSHHQGAINWKQTASELRRVNGGTSPGFAILRVGYSARHGKGGLWMDNQWTKNVEGCEAYGVPMGVYVYSYDTSPEAAAITARQVVNQLRGHILVISMEKKVENEDKENKKYLRREFSYTKFQQSLYLPDNVDKEKITANVANGVLTIELPKYSQEEKAKINRVIEIH